MDPQLERRFDAAMLEIYDRAGREVGYWATRYLQLVRRRGGLGAARYLLASKVTSDGYARLRDAGRLDLTVEALVLQPEYAPLFTAEELARARDRQHAFRSMPMSAELEPPAALLALLEEAAGASPDSRIGYRDRVAAFGAPAIVAMQRWVDTGGSPGFAIAVIEVVGRDRDRPRAVAALHAIRGRDAAWAQLAAAAISRLTRAK